MKKFFKFLPLIIIPLALVAALYLVRQRQETRKSAAGVNIDAYLAGSASDGSMPVKFWVNPGSERLVAFAIKFKYTTSTLSLDSVKLHSNFSGDDPDLQVARIIRKKTNTPGEIEIVALSYNGVTGTMSSSNPLVDLDFSVTGEGTAKVWVDGTYDHYQFARQGGDHLLNLSGDLEVSQTITGPTATPTNTPVPTNTPIPTVTSTPVPTATEVPAVCTNGEKDCGGVNDRPRECVDGQWVLQSPCGTGMECESGECVAVATATKAEATATGGVGDCHPCDTHAQGDADCDGDVDLLDLNTWMQEKYYESGLTADFDCNDAVTLMDLNIWIQGKYYSD